MTELSMDNCRDDFPALAEPTPSGKPLIYLDSAATALRPKAVLDSVIDAMTHRTGGIHRSVNFLGDRATELYEEARWIAARWVGGIENEIVFTRNTTESLNLLARGWKKPGRILVSATDHHSSMLAWDPAKTLCVPAKPGGWVDQERIENELSKGDISVVCLSHISNVTGAAVDAARIAHLAHRAGAIMVLDAAQSAPHGPLDIQQLDCDFLAFSGHKLGASSGIGILWGKSECLQKLEPVYRGGGVIESMRDGVLKFKDDPWRLEAGTPALEAAASLAAAMDYLRNLDPERIAIHLKDLRSYTLTKLKTLPKLRLLCDESTESMGPVSFCFEGLPSHMIARNLSDSHGICIRSGYQCAEPLHRSLGVGPSLRISLFVYNRRSDIDTTVEAMRNFIHLNAS